MHLSSSCMPAVTIRTSMHRSHLEGARHFRKKHMPCTKERELQARLCSSASEMDQHT